MKGSLAQLIEYWITKYSEADKRELAIVLLESIRDDIPQAVTNDGKAVTSSRDVQKYLDEQVSELLRPSESCGLSRLRTS